MGPDSARNALRAALLLAALAASSACGAQKPPPETRPALTDEKIRESLVDSTVGEVPEETGAARPISWRFLSQEPTEIAVVERQMDGDRATAVVDVTTRTVPGSRSPRVLSGRLRLHYELQTIVFLRKWRVVHIDNISMKYRDEPKPDSGPEPAPEPPGGPGPPVPPQPR